MYEIIPIKKGKPKTREYALIFPILILFSIIFVSFVFGKGPSGIGTSRKLHKGFHPSLTL